MKKGTGNDGGNLRLAKPPPAIGRSGRRHRAGDAPGDENGGVFRDPVRQSAMPIHRNKEPAARPDCGPKRRRRYKDVVRPNPESSPENVQTPAPGMPGLQGLLVGAGRAVAKAQTFDIGNMFHRPEFCG